MKHLRILLFSLTFLAFFAQAHAQTNQPVVVVMQANGAIIPVMQDYIHRGIQTAEQQNAEALVIELNTPGGDIATMLNIIQDIRDSSVPVIVYVAPKGAIAGSAGALITMAGHASAMAPESAIGASSPISSSGQNLDSTLETKQKEILKAKARTLIQQRGETAVILAEAMIDNAKAVTANEALDAGLIDFTANDTNDLLQKLNGFTVQINNGAHKLNTANARAEPLDMSFIEQFLLLLTDPNIAFLLLAIGVQAILIEISSPGGWVAGFVGAVCLTLAIYGMGVLPVNWFGIIFLVIAFILFILDIKAPTHGALTTAGVTSFIIGALVLFNSPSTPQFQRVSVPLVVGVGIFFGLIFFTVVVFALRAQRGRIQTGTESLVGKRGTARTFMNDAGQVQVESELWSAEKSTESEAISKGDRVEVVEVSGIRLKVRKIK